MDQVFAYMFTDTIFKDMETSYFFDFGCVVCSLIRNLCSLLTTLLANILNSCEYLLNSAWKLLQFSNVDKTDTAASELYKMFGRFLFIGLIVSVVIVFGKMIFSQNGIDGFKNFMNNTLVLAIALLILPSVFTVVNSSIFEEDSSLLTANATNTSSSIVFRHTTDYLYCYKKYVKEYLDEPTVSIDDAVKNKKFEKITKRDKDTKNWTLTKKNYFSKKLDTKKMNDMDITRFNLNITIDEDSMEDEDSSVEVPEFFKKRLTSSVENSLTNTLSYTVESLKKIYNTITGNKTMSLRAGVLGLGAEHYYRYKTDYLCVFLEMIANIFLYVGAAFALVKIAWELMINRIILGFIGASDLNGGERLKRVLTSILGLYLSIMFVGFTITLFNNACTFASDTLKINGLGYSLIVVFLALVALDGPNIVARLFNVNTGMRGGAAMLAGGLMFAGRAGSRAIANRAHRVGDGLMKDMRAARAGRATGGSASPSSTVGMGNLSSPGGMAMASNIPVQSQLPASNIPVQSQLPVGKKSLNDYKNQVAKDNPDMSKEDVEQTANQLKANDDKDNIFEKAMLGQASSEMSGNPMSDKDSIMGAMQEKSQGVNKDYDPEHIDSVSDNLLSNGAYSDYKDQSYKDIISDAQSLLSSGDKYTAKPMQAYEDAAGRFGATDETQKYIGNMAYAKANSDSIDKAATSYMNSEHSRGNRKINKQDATEYVIRNNVDGCATGINPQYANSIAHNLIYDDSHKPNYRGRNRGAGAFYQ